MRRYATLLIEETKYELVDEDRNIILTENFRKMYYIYEKSIVFNMLAKHGWKVEFCLGNKDWYMMSRRI